MGRRILLVEDYGGLRRGMRCALARAGHEVVEAGSLAAARQALGAGRFDLVLLDLSLPDGRGEALLPELEAREPRAAVVVISGHAGAQVAYALQLRGVVVLGKPVEPELLVRVAGQAARRLPAAEGRSRSGVLAAYAARHRLSGREGELLRLACARRTLEQAAAELRCTTSTVKSYWRRIFAKTGQRSQRDVLADVLGFGGERAGGAGRDRRDEPPEQCARAGEVTGEASG